MKNKIHFIIFLFLCCSCKEGYFLSHFDAQVTDFFDIELENELNANYKIKVIHEDNVTKVNVIHNNPCYYCCETIIGTTSRVNGKIKLIAEYNKPINKIGKNAMVQLGTCTILYTYEIKGLDNKLTDSDFVFEFIHFRTKNE